MFSGTRANIYIAFAIAIVYIMFVSKGNAKKVFLILIVGLIAYLSYDFMSDKIAIINIAKSGGDLVRERTIPSIMREMNNKPIYWFLGMGHGSEYYSYGRNEVVSTSELSYLEMLRTVGLFGTIPFIIFLIYPIKKIAKSEMKWVLLPYFSLLINSIVDPLLHTSTSFLMYIVIYYTYYLLRQEEQNN